VEPEEGITAVELRRARHGVLRHAYLLDGEGTGRLARTG